MAIWKATRSSKRRDGVAMECDQGRADIPCVCFYLEGLSSPFLLTEVLDCVDRGVGATSGRSASYLR